MQLTDRQYEKFARVHPPIGKLAERHPTLLFAVVHLHPALGHVAVFMGGVHKLDAGTRVTLWGRGEVTV